MRAISVNLVLVASLRLLFLYSFMGPFNMYLVHFTFIKVGFPVYQNTRRQILQLKFSLKY